MDDIAHPELHAWNRVRATDPGGVLEIRASRAAQVLWVVALAATIDGIVTAWQQGQALYIWSRVAFALFGLVYLVASRRPWLRADDAGIRVGLLRPRRVDWSDVEQISLLPPPILFFALQPTIRVEVRGAGQLKGWAPTAHLVKKQVFVEQGALADLLAARSGVPVRRFELGAWIATEP